MPVWPGNNVMISSALAYASGIQFDLIGRFIPLEDVKIERRVLDLGVHLYDPSVNGFWRDKVELLQQPVAVRFVRRLGGQGFIRGDEVCVLTPRQVWAYDKPMLALFPTGSQWAYAPASMATVNGPIRYQKTEGDPNLLLLKGKLQFSRLMNEECKARVILCAFATPRGRISVAYSGQRHMAYLAN